MLAVALSGSATGGLLSEAFSMAAEAAATVVGGHVPSDEVTL
jgi:hypothetical protein